MAIPDIRTGPLDSWDLYKDRTPDEIVQAIHAHVDAVSSQVRGWYWASIHTKRWTSLPARGLAFLLLLAGATLPLLAATQPSDHDKLLYTQLGVACLVLAGMAQLADRVFGWSSGWMRYISTVTAMENLTRAFEIEWGRYLVNQDGPLDMADAQALFELARALEQAFARLQAEETTQWVAEFNSGIALLDSMIRSQREAADPKTAPARSGAAARKASARTGALEVTLSFQGAPQPVLIGLGDETPAAFSGTTWSRPSVAPGRHVVHVVTTAGPPSTVQRIAEVAADTVARLDVTVPG